MRIILTSVVGILLWLAGPALGQINEAGVKTDNIEMLPAKEPLVEYALAGCFLLGALAIGFKTSKRVPE